MKIPYNWLKKYVATKKSVQELSELLTMAGLEITAIEEKSQDTVMEMEITSNRPDWLSIIGVAREVAAITNAKLKLPPMGLKNKIKDKTLFTVLIDDAKACPRYSGRLIANVKIGPSPDWLASAIEAIGLRPVNNVVDITNFCMFELGQPMHAFDFDKLNGNKIVIRPAKPGESIVLIDGSHRELTPDILVIADAVSPIAIAGIMGGLETQVTGETKNILLETAFFDPLSIRRASRKLRISTDSSYCFERRVDAENIIFASQRATNLIIELANGSLGNIADVYKGKVKPAMISFFSDNVAAVLGIDIPARISAAILKKLGCRVAKGKNKTLKVLPPSFRYDLKQPIDLIEEIGRVFGYDRIPETIPAIMARGRGNSPKAKDFVIKESIKDILVGCGLNEAVTYSLLGEGLLAAAAVSLPVVEIRNPLNAEQRFMRPELLPGMLRTVVYNLNRYNLNLKIFELGNVYQPEAAGSPREDTHLALVLSGERFNNWQMHKQAVDFYYLKGIVEGLLSKLGVKECNFVEAAENIFSPGACAAVMIKGSDIGRIGQISELVLKALDIKQDVYAAEINISALLKYINQEPRYSPVPRYPAILRDVSLLIKTQVKSQEIIDLIASAGRGLVKGARLFDEYRGSQILAGHKSLAYSIEYQSAERTLTDIEVSALHRDICKKIAENFGAEIR